MRKAAKAVCRQRRASPRGQPLSGVGVSATGQIDSRKPASVAGTCGNLPQLHRLPHQGRELGSLDFGLPVTVANDANCMSLGRSLGRRGAKGYTDVIGVTLGTGVGGGILTGGRLLEGARGLGGELGHYRLPRARRRALHLRGRRLLGALRRHHRPRPCCAKEKDPCLDRLAAPSLPPQQAGSPRPCWPCWIAWTDEIAQGLAGMVHIFNPQLILIGGGVSAQQKLLIDPIAAKVKASVMPAFAEGLEIRAAQLHNDAGMVGAVYYFRQTMEKE